jgi:hypothetical protein
VEGRSGEREPIEPLEKATRDRVPYGRILEQRVKTREIQNREDVGIERDKIEQKNVDPEGSRERKSNENA